MLRSPDPGQQIYAVEEYLWEEQRSPVKREFNRGQVYAIAGGGLNHYVVIDSEQARVEIRQRVEQEDSWLEPTPLEDLNDVLKLKLGRDVAIPLDALYRGINLEGEQT